MSKRKNYDRRAVARLFAAQGGLATRSQLIDLGVPPSTIRHRERPDGPWRRVLKGVCANHGQALTGLGALRAALLFAGPGSIVTGFAALRAHRIAAADASPACAAAAVVTDVADPAVGPAIESAGAFAPPTVRVLIPAVRRRTSAGFVLVSRTRRMPEPVEIEGCRVAPVTRAAVDACLETKDTELIRRIVAELVHSGRSSPADLRAELDANQTQRSARMRAVLVEFADGIRTGAEAQCRRRLARVAAPQPQWNRRIIEQATGRVAVLPGALWPEHGIALDLDPTPLGAAAAHEPAVVRRRWLSSVLRMTVAHVTPSEVRDRWDDVWAELRALLNRPPTYRLPAGYVFA